MLVIVFGLAVTGTALATETNQGSSRVTISFIGQDNFTDAKDGATASDGGRDLVLRDLKAHIEAQAVRYLAEGQRLEINVTDVDLAGGFEPWRGLDYDHIRIMREIYPPRMDLSFRLIGIDGKVLSEGKRHLQDPGYLMNTVMSPSDPLRYDKEMIRSWMRREFKRST